MEILRDKNGKQQGTIREIAGGRNGFTTEPARDRDLPPKHELHI